METQLRQVGVDIDKALFRLALLRSSSTQFKNLSVALETQINRLSVQDLHTSIYHKSEPLKRSTDDNTKALRAQMCAQNSEEKTNHLLLLQEEGA